MAFPTVTVNTENLDSDLDSPTLARADLLDAVEKLNTIIDEAGNSLGVALLDAAGRLTSSQMPVVMSVAGTQVLSPTGGIVNIQTVLRLTAITTAEILALESPSAGDMVMAYDLGAGEDESGIVFYDGTNWRSLSFASEVFTTLA